MCDALKTFRPASDASLSVEARFSDAFMNLYRQYLRQHGSHEVARRLVRLYIQSLMVHAEEMN